MFTDLQYAYLVGDLIFAAVWLLLFIKRRDLHREMIFVGSIMGAVAIAVAPIFYDYWVPQYVSPLRIEEFLYGFFAGGIASTLYEFAYGQRLTNRNGRSMHAGLLLAAMCTTAALCFGYMMWNGVLSVSASALLLLLCGAWLLLYRRDLAKDALMSGLLFSGFTAIFFVAYTRIFPTVINAWWNVPILTGVNVLGFPLEEVIWAFCFGFIAGPMYEFVAGLRFKARRTS